MSIRLFFLLALALLSGLRSEAGALARFRMGLGTVDVELFDQDKPVTVSNFVEYVRAGAWTDTMMHRWIRNFVIQGGSFHLPIAANGFTPLSTQPQAIQTFPPIVNEYSVGRTFSNVYGTIAMARVDDQPNSATASWFFNLASNTFLDAEDGGFTVFGRMLRGNAVLDRFNMVAGTANIYYLQAGSEVPVYSEDGRNGFWLNVNISLLTVEIARVAGGMEISWNSVEGLPNVVEFTSTRPPQWTEVGRVAGTGARMSITDPPSSDGMRQYRVRIVYPN